MAPSPARFRSLLKYHHLERCYWPPHKRAAPLSSTPSRSSLLIDFLLTHVATWYSSPCRLLSVSYIRASAPRGQAYRFVCCCTSTRPVSNQCMSNGHKNEPLHHAQLLLFSSGFGSEHLRVTLPSCAPAHCLPLGETQMPGRKATVVLCAPSACQSLRAAFWPVSIY